MSDIVTVAKKRQYMLRHMDTYLAYLRYLRENYSNINDTRFKLVWKWGDNEGVVNVSEGSS